jgi:hypothetical protein
MQRWREKEKDAVWRHLSTYLGGINFSVKTTALTATPKKRKVRGDRQEDTQKNKTFFWLWIVFLFFK